ncbi:MULTISPECIES: hypothetical protein [Snuella]|uniref:Uncharacterized protein n=1 Tax=Snuella sedimenti TaxID=2798802 RepID=A0A8J7IGG5_9FLAO|nr:hypothetical protein [Snuella sedimenti]MBJ6369152.1 hypothetical protein [Snuella sedimenti]
METRVKRVLEIPARKSQNQESAHPRVSDRSFHLIIDLWIFKFEYSKERFP